MRVLSFHHEDVKAQRITKEIFSALSIEQTEGLVCLGRVRSVIVSNPIGVRLLSTLPRRRLRLKQKAEISPVVAYLFECAGRPAHTEQFAEIAPGQSNPGGARYASLGSLTQSGFS